MPNKNKDNHSILTITGSDSTSGAGIQADVKTATALGTEAYTAITTVTAQDDRGISSIYELPVETVTSQVRTVIDHFHPKAVKVGMVRNADAINAISHEIVGIRNIVLAPGILSSRGERLLDDDAVSTWQSLLLPMATMLLMSCREAEVMLGMTISTDSDMIRAAEKLQQAGAKTVLLRGGHLEKDTLTALLYHKDKAKFFSSYNMDGWQRHGVGGALSTAIAVRLAMGDDISKAVRNAHEYIHSQVVYAVMPSKENIVASGYRPADIYNNFMSLLADNYREAHDVAFYAGRMAITTRYLLNVTTNVANRSPKRIIMDYLVEEAKKLLSTSRLTIQEISNYLGFSSQSIFCDFFCANTGSTPSAYRRESVRESSLFLTL